MYNLNKIYNINDKFALLNSGDFLMHIDEVEEILKACKTYLKKWKQDEIEIYNAALLSHRHEQQIDDNKRYRALSKKRKEERDAKRFLYLIQNKRNGLYKIGVSITPIKRERTLQGEEPEIEILAIFNGGFELERCIHKHFEGKRVRGEWFNLDGEDLIVLKERFLRTEEL